MVDCIEIVVPGETFRIATSREDLVLGERTFHPSAVVVTAASNVELVVVLPVDHAFSVRYLAGGAPKSQTKIRWERVDEDGTVLRRFSGEIVSADLDQREVRLRVISDFVRALRRPMSRIVSRTCQHRLFDVGCQLDRTMFTESAMVIAVNHYELTLSTGIASDWAIGGVLLHVASNEKSAIVAQRAGSSASEAVVTLQARSYNARIGDAVEVSAGCDKQVATCRDKFHNVVNFGGFPHLPDKNPFEA